MVLPDAAVVLVTGLLITGTDGDTVDTTGVASLFAIYNLI